MPFGDSCNKLAKEYGTKNRVWASWGDGDRVCFKQECKDKDATYPFSDTHFNISALFSLAMKKRIRISVKNALEIIGKEFEGQEHNGADDAYNTARIFKYLLKVN